MKSNCCQALERELPLEKSPFDRVIAIDYYDGLTRGIAECGVCKTLFSVNMIDSSPNRDIRVFSLANLPAADMDSVIQGVPDSFEPRWPMWVLFISQKNNSLIEAIENLISVSKPPYFIVASIGILSEFIAVRASISDLSLDWFSEFEI